MKQLLHLVLALLVLNKEYLIMASRTDLFYNLILILCINDLPNSFNYSEVIICMDDTSLIKTFIVSDRLRCG